MQPSPLEISNLRLRLRNLRDGVSQFHELSEVLDEIAGLGQHGGQLIPDLVVAMKRGIFIPTIPLVPIITRLKNTELLSVALEQNNGQWPLNVFERCELLKAGFHQFQQLLLDELFQVFEQDDQLSRSAIVDALAVAGTFSAIETLRVIEYRTAARIPELNAERNTGDSATQALNQLQRGENLDARRAFLEKVRRAIQSIGDRPDPQTVGQTGEAIHQSQTAIGEGAIELLLQKEEGSELEFKAALRWDHVKKAVDPKLEYRVLCVITAFANAAGGTLLIGVDPQKKIVGLMNDYVSLKGDQDAFERHLKNLVSAKCGKVFNVSALDVSFHTEGQHHVCRVTVSRANGPIFLKWDGEEEFWVRNGNANIQLKGKDLTDYVQDHFAQ